LARQVNMGMQQSPGFGQIPQEESLRLRRNVEEIYSAQKLRASAQRSISKQLSTQEYAEVIQWYDSALGQLFTGIEESASASLQDVSVAISNGNDALAASTAERQVLLSKLVRATKANEFTVNVMIQTALGVYQGISTVLPMNGAPSSAGFRAALEKQRPQLLAASLGTCIALFAATYSPASDSELSQYIEFLSSKTGVHWTAVMSDALNNGLSRAAIELGKKLPKEKAKQTL